MSFGTSSFPLSPEMKQHVYSGPGSVCHLDPMPPGFGVNGFLVWQHPTPNTQNHPAAKVTHTLYGKQNQHFAQ